jgi:hypothetical protein
VMKVESTNIAAEATPTMISLLFSVGLFAMVFVKVRESKTHSRRELLKFLN